MLNHLFTLFLFMIHSMRSIIYSYEHLVSDIFSSAVPHVPKCLAVEQQK